MLVWRISHSNLAGSIRLRDRSAVLILMKEYRIMFTVSDVSEIGYVDPLYAGDMRRSLSQVYDWENVHANGAYTFNWIFKLCVF